MQDEPESFEAEIDGFPVAKDQENLPARDKLEVLMSRFAGQVRSGEAISYEEYGKEHPRESDEINELLPLVELLERWKSEKDLQCARQNLPAKLPFNRLGQYEILRELGRGGMGLVVEAQESRSLQRVAIKLLPWQYVADLQNRRQRFYREAATIGSMRHPNIVGVQGYGERDGYCYYVMDLIEGVSLDRVSQRLRSDAAPITADEIRRTGNGIEGTATPDKSKVLLTAKSWATFAGIGAQAAAALAYAHRRGVLHHDVKPANLLLDYKGHVVLTDFGVGLRSQDDLSGKDDHATATVRYIAPERLIGSCDVRSDVYSLGVTLYELTTGMPAFPLMERGPLISSILEAPVQPPRHIAPGMPRALERVIVKAMQRKPENRYETADAIAADLLTFSNRYASSGRFAFLRNLFRR